MRKSSAFFPGSIQSLPVPMQVVHFILLCGLWCVSSKYPPLRPVAIPQSGRALGFLFGYIIPTWPTIRHIMQRSTPLLPTHIPAASPSSTVSCFHMSLSKNQSIDLFFDLSRRRTCFHFADACVPNTVLHWAVPAGITQANLRRSPKQAMPPCWPKPRISGMPPIRPTPSLHMHHTAAPSLDRTSTTLIFCSSVLPPCGLLFPRVCSAYQGKIVQS